jgi:ribonuclease D
VTEAAEELGMPVENVLTPDHLRRVAWQPPAEPTVANVSDALAELGARPWQLEATSHRIAEAFVKAAQSLEDAAHEPS